MYISQTIANPTACNGATLYPRGSYKFLDPKMFKLWVVANCYPRTNTCENMSTNTTVWKHWQYCMAFLKPYFFGHTSVTFLHYHFFHQQIRAEQIWPDIATDGQIYRRLARWE
jgi:hypothetical protein